MKKIFVLLAASILCFACGGKKSTSINDASEDIRKAVAVIDAEYNKEKYIGAFIEGQNLVFAARWNEEKAEKTISELKQLEDFASQEKTAWSQGMRINLESSESMAYRDALETFVKHQFNIVERIVGEPSGETYDMLVLTVSDLQELLSPEGYHDNADVFVGEYYPNTYPDYDPMKDDYYDYLKDSWTLGDVLLRQIAVTKINSAGRVLYEGKEYRPYEIQKPIERFILNFLDDLQYHNYSSAKSVYYLIIEKDEEIDVNHPSFETVAEQYLLAVQSVRQQLAEKMYGKDYSCLTRSEKSEIQSMTPNGIYVMDHQMMTPPPPPVDDEIIEVIDDYEGYYEPEEEVVEAEEEEVPFVIVEDMPEFPGGTAAMFKFLSENVKYPVIAQENGIQGKVQCQFIVEKDGSITNVEVVRSAGDASLDKEAIRVIKSMPKWKPGKEKGKAVRVKFSIPVNFKLQ